VRSGTGKEVVARAIHDASLRAKAKCSRQLRRDSGQPLESELFGP